MPPLTSVHRNVYVPYTLTVALDVALLAFENTTVPGPACFVHVPVPNVGTAASVAMFVPQRYCAGPASATGLSYIVNVRTGFIHGPLPQPFLPAAVTVYTPGASPVRSIAAWLTAVEASSDPATPTQE